MKKRNLFLVIVTLLFLISISYVYGLKADGESCTVNTDCISNICKDTPEGKRCIGNDYWVGNCGTGYSCNSPLGCIKSGSPSKLCASSYYCESNSCLEKKGNGQACQSNVECYNTCYNNICATVSYELSGNCGYGLICSNDQLSCTSGAGTVKVCQSDKYCKPSTDGDGCVSKKANGQNCVANAECINNFCQSGKCGKADGNSCDTNADCASNNCYQNICRSNNNWIGPCSYLTICSGDATRCAVSTQGTQICNTKYYCKDGACIIKKINGNICSNSYECASGICEKNKCGKADGSSCSSNDQCISNECYQKTCRSSSSWIGACPSGVCQDSTKCTLSSQGLKTICNIKYYCGTNACIAKGSGGASCSNNYECASGSCTINSKTKTGSCTAVALKVNGETCSSNSECQSNNCLGGKCAAQLKANGEGCILKSECQSGNCINGICGTLKINGETCISNSECTSGYCDGILTPKLCRPVPIIQNLCGSNYNCNAEHDKCVPKSANDPIVLCPISAGIPYYCLEAGGGANCGLQKKFDGMGCNNNYECRSNSCVGKVCAAAKKLNGETCTMNSDCQSGNCENSLTPVVCRPSKIIGWPSFCGINYGCSVDGSQCDPKPDNLFENIKICDTNNYCSIVSGEAVCTNVKKNQGVSCSNNYECKSNLCFGGKCSTCVDSSSCGQGQKCYSGFCIPDWFCGSDADCPNGQQCLDDNHCIEGTICEADDDCFSEFGDLGICNENLCYQACDSVNFCSNGQVCELVGGGEIGVCLVDTDGDGFSDQQETDAGTNSNDPNNNPGAGGGNGGGSGGGSGGGGGGGGSGGGSGSSGGSSLVPKTCSGLGGIVCTGSQECVGSEISDAKEVNCCNGNCKSKPVYIQQTSSSVTFVRSCIQGGKTQVQIMEDGVPVQDEGTLSALGVSSNTYVDPDDYSCFDIEDSGQPVYGYGLLGLLITLSLLTAFYSLRRRFI